MAIDYGLSTALSGFFGSGDKKAIRQQEMQTMMQMYQMEEQKKNQEMQLGMQMEEYIGSADDAARKIIMQQGIREEDRVFIQDQAKAERSVIEEKVRKHGSILKYLRAGGYKDLMGYKNKILGSEKMAELESNATVFSKILQAKNDPKTAHLMFQKDVDNLRLYQSGKVDNLTWSGTMSELELEGVQNEYSKDQEITEEMILDYGNNRNLVKHNMSREYGYQPEDLTDDLMLQWVSTRYGTKSGAPMHGAQDVKATPSNDILTSLKSTPTRLADFNADLHNEFIDGAGIIWNTKMGYDASGETEWKRGMRPKTSGRVVTNVEAEKHILNATFAGGDEGSVRFTKRGKRKIYGVKSAGLYLHNGSQITEDETGFWNLEGDIAPTLHYQGMFVGLKGEGINRMTGKHEKFLITDIKDDKKRAEMQELYGDVKVQSVMLAELRDSDLIRDDLYYKEIDVQSDYFRGSLNKSMDINEDLTVERNMNIDTHHKIKQKQVEINRQLQSQKKLAKAYGDGSPESVLTLMDTFGNPLQKKMQVSGIPNHMYPILMAELMESVNPKSSNPANELMNIISNFNTYAMHPNNAGWFEVLKGGDVGNYYKFMENNNTKLANKIRKSAGVWSDVLKTE